MLKGRGGGWGGYLYELLPGGELGYDVVPDAPGVRHGDVEASRGQAVSVAGQDVLDALPGHNAHADVAHLSGL